MEKDIGKIKKNDFTDIVIRIDNFGGRTGVTIREFVTGERYTGFTKSGVKISASEFKNFKEMINSISDEDLKEEPKSEESESEEKKKEPAKKREKSQKTIDEEMPDY